jgi:hypothetical protein
MFFFFKFLCDLKFYIKIIQSTINAKCSLVTKNNIRIVLYIKNTPMCVWDKIHSNNNNYFIQFNQSLFY